MLDWNRFESLTGLPANNFEKLCRSIVRRQFGSLGILRELKNQPGVEFHITLNKDSSQFGIKDETVGWQCKWFEYRANGELTSSAKSQIQDSLDKTVKHLPSMSHWILWTHKTLSKVDQNWYYGLASSLGFKLYLWNADDIDSFLAGTSLELRNSYFGELALTRQILEQQHAEAVAPISSRWMKLTHQQTKEEREIRQSLGEPAAFDRFKSICSRLSKAKNAIVEVVDTADYCPWAAELKRFIGTCETVVGYADFFQSPVGAGDIDKIAAMVEASKTLLSVMIYKLMSKLRKFNLPLAIPVTNAVAYIKDTNAILQTVHESVTRSFIAILADAGGGKTQLAAALTAPQDNRAAGILLLGRDLRKGCTLDKLAAKYSFYGKAVESFNAILAALDAAAYRDNCRLPIVIDGLNEAEDPRDWKYLLAPIIERLKHYPNVLLVCTLRTGEKKRANSDSFSVTEGSREEFAKMALPENCHTLISKGFDGLTQQAVEAYFHHFKIVADPQLAPIDFFSHPLNLRIFCEVTNRKAQAPVHVTSFPASISTLFEKQIDHVAVRIAELPNLHRVYKKEDVLRAIFEFGVLLWECNTRSVCEDEFLDKVSLRGQNWDESFVNLLAQEGILFRDSAEQPHAYILTPVYDRLGGYLIASMLLHSHRGEAFERFVKQEDSIDAIFGGRELSHPLSQDIFRSLISLAPKYLKRNLWQLLPEQYVDSALMLSPFIDAENLCCDTISAYKEMILRKKLPRAALERLLELRYAAKHPLNILFLDVLLRELTVTQRDLYWTEFFRPHADDMVESFEAHIVRWEKEPSIRTESDWYRAIYISWQLTSTNSELRDITTKALYAYGIGAPRQLFELAISALQITDAYVPERVFAASYAVATLVLLKQGQHNDVLWFAKQILVLMFGENAQFPTTHLLLRDYASNTVKLAHHFMGDTVTKEELAMASHPFATMPRLKWGEDPAANGLLGYDGPLRMDFANYTIGRLISDRGNYDDSHPEYKVVKSQILWRVKLLGWNEAQFNKVDSNIESVDARHSRFDNSKVERYGKKYSWIAYHEVAGKLTDEEKLEPVGERFIADIDPFFPKQPEPVEVVQNKFISDASITTTQWISDETSPDLTDILIASFKESEDDDWVLLNGQISEQSKRLDRDFYIDVRTFIVPEKVNAKLLMQYSDEKIKEINRPEIPSSYSIYIGEYYWRTLPDFEEPVQFSICVGKETRILPDWTAHDIDGGVSFVFEDKEQLMPKYEEIEVQTPVIKYHWESESKVNESCQQMILAKPLVEKLHLSFNPSTFEYFDENGRPAVKLVRTVGSAFSNHQNLMYIRKDLLMDYLEMLDLKLLWCMKGEKRVISISHSPDERRLQYRDFVNAMAFKGHI